MHAFRQHGRHGGGRVRGLAGQHLVQDGPEAVDVGAAVQAAFARRLLRAHVGRGADEDARVRQPVASRDTDGVRDAEVADHRVAEIEQHVLGFDIAMDDAPTVRVRQRVGDLARDAQRVLDRELLLAGQPRPQ